MGQADVVVVGGGVVGASIAYHLARRGMRVLICDGGGLPGATTASAAQVRIHHSDPFDARLAATGLATYESWADVIGGDCGFRRTGFAFLTAARYRDSAGKVAVMLAQFGVEAQLIAPDDYARAHPALVMDGVGVVAYEPRGGYADPVLTTRTLLARAVDHGARRATDGRVLALLRQGERIAGVRLRDGTYSAGHVVLAAGVHTRELCAAMDLTVPVRTKRIGFALADAPAGGHPVPHVTIDDTLGVYFRPHGRGKVWFGVPMDEWDLAAATRPPAPAAALVERVRDRLTARIPSIRGARLCGGGSALEAYTPDGHAIIGDAVPGGYLATGFSGGGFKLAPAVGEAVADELVSGRPRPELEPYRLDRFANQTPIHPRYQYANL